MVFLNFSGKQICINITCYVAITNSTIFTALFTTYIFLRFFFLLIFFFFNSGNGYFITALIFLNICLSGSTSMLADLNLQQLNNVLMSENIQMQYIYCLIQSTINIHLKRRTSNTNCMCCLS